MSAPAVASSSARQHGSSVRRHPVVTFYVLAYTLAWITWLPIILSDTGLGVLRFSLPVAFCALATVPDPSSRPSW